MERILEMAGDDNKGALTPARPDLLFGLAGNIVLQHLTGSEIRRRLGEKIHKEYFKFAFVRNPYDRLVSIYSNRLTDLPRRRTSFRDFILKRVVKGEQAGLQTLFHTRQEKVLEIQFRSQFEFVFDENNRLLADFIGKVENLDADFKVICDRLGIDAMLTQTNRSKRDDYRSYYDAETRKAVADIYHKDFEMFGYDF